jgi:hypothetical protein
VDDISQPAAPAFQPASPVERPARWTIAPWKRPVMVLVLFTMAVGAGALAGALESGLTPSETVIGAVASALSDSTAHLAFDESIAAGSTNVSVSGSGSVDFTNGSVEESITEPSEGSILTIDVVDVGGIVYVQVPDLSQIDPGKAWLSIDLSALTKDERASGLTSLGSDPAATLRLLEQQGNTVTPIGSSMVDGQSVQGYTVTYNVAAVENAISSSGAPAWLRAAMKRVDLTNETSTVYVNASDQLVRLTNAVGLTLGGATGAVNGSVDFSDYGAAVSISPPPASQVMGFSQFLQSVGGVSDT